MLWKILLTLLVVMAGYLILKNKRVLESAVPVVKTVKVAPPKNKVKWLALAVLILSMLGGTLMALFSWQDDHRIYEVKIINPQTGQQEVFKAYKKDLNTRHFTTLSGQQVTASELERLVFEELKQ